MKAIIQDRYGGPEHLRLADIPVPEPVRSQIRVRVLACAVNLSDWEHLIGSPLYARLVGGLMKPKRQVLGSDIVGIIDKLGPNVTDFQIGDRVMGDLVMQRGGFAQYACVSAAEMVRVPDGLSDEVAACLPQAGGIAVAGTEGLKQGDAFLINGAGGGSGTMALQLAKAAGAHVTAVDNASKIDWLKSLGADDVIDYRKQDFTEIRETMEPNSGYGRHARPGQDRPSPLWRRHLQGRGRQCKYFAASRDRWSTLPRSEQVHRDADGSQWPGPDRKGCENGRRG